MERPIAMVASIRLWKRQTRSALRVLKNVSTMALSKPFPLPDIEIEMPFFSQLSLGLDGAVLAATVRVVNEPGGWAPHGDGPAEGQ
jgi:hypothetical protein